jgi:hypothetical protein
MSPTGQTLIAPIVHSPVEVDLNSDSAETSKATMISELISLSSLIADVIEIGLIYLKVGNVSKAVRCQWPG